MLNEFPETLVSIEWHSPSFTPGSSDFDLPSEYSQRSGMYGVGGIPHSQWNGVESTVGGYPNGNWDPMYNAFMNIYDNMDGDETPYEIEINGMFDQINDEVTYDVTVTMDADMSSTNQKVDIFVVEDNIWSYWAAVGIYHNARNVARDWITTDGLDLTISSSGESQIFTGTFDVSDAWVSDSVKIIAIVQNYGNPKQIYQVNQININDMNPDVEWDLSLDTKLKGKAQGDGRARGDGKTKSRNRNSGAFSERGNGYNYPVQPYYPQQPYQGQPYPYPPQQQQYPVIPPYGYAPGYGQSQMMPPMQQMPFPPQGMWR